MKLLFIVFMLVPVKVEPEFQTFEATAYTSQCDGCIGITKTGIDVRNTIYNEKGQRIIAVDPNVIPLGTLVEVRLKNGQIFVAEAADTGGAIKGKRIDILVETKKQAYQFGRQTVEVRPLQKTIRYFPVYLVSP